MAVYEYKGLNDKGKSISGLVDADSPKSARDKLRRDDIFPTSLTEGKETKSLSREIDLKQVFERIGTRDIAIMTRQMSTLLRAGLPLISTLNALADQVESSKLRKVISQIRERVNEGASLATAMSDYPHIFPDLYVNMVAAGESSGSLEIVLSRLADYMEDQVQIKNKILTAMAYPIIMVCIAIAVIGILFTYVIPKFVEIFEDIHQALPLPTQVLIALAEFSQKFWWLIVILVIAAVYGLRHYRNTEKGRDVFDRTSLRIPIFGTIIRLAAISRFTKTLSTLLASGIPLLKALDIVKRIVNNTVISEAVENASENIKEGASIADPLRRSGVFPPMVTHMIASGEQSGELESMLEKVSEFFDSEVEIRVTAMTTLLEPIMILIMAGVVGFIVVSILLPLLQMNQIIQ
ncbi:type II secretion system inner membrane protein GspF [Thermodesulfobacteriota bacterium]